MVGFSGMGRRLVLEVQVEQRMAGDLDDKLIGIIVSVNGNGNGQTERGDRTPKSY